MEISINPVRTKSALLVFSLIAILSNSINKLPEKIQFLFGEQTIEFKLQLPFSISLLLLSSFFYLSAAFLRYRLAPNGYLYLLRNFSPINYKSLNMDGLFGPGLIEEEIDLYLGKLKKLKSKLAKLMPHPNDLRSTLRNHDKDNEQKVRKEIMELKTEIREEEEISFYNCKQALDNSRKIRRFFVSIFILLSNLCIIFSIIKIVEKGCKAMIISGEFERIVPQFLEVVNSCKAIILLMYNFLS
jgi:hypothetical protein